ncbi:flavin reductase family protein [Amnibacterium kyonggiense]|uniref:Flavin reductase (DIM6/NTAB) family NADH-FMN oxidoreductase RutF n=1 Tax=Amnibacterium kyonggiense TaxID=595671 RepID=A0A4R7FS49_9MICO|nr:flavin reductase family protein [Amnibacterium kyonggiense]TDS80667.1 flavin reductase (DIM6/NTAB) family NADH-FMN oxidoreductase RutF [Amnibacterium kyonggiense]
MAPLVPLDPAPGSMDGALRRAFGLFPSGVAAVAAEVDGAPRVLVVSSFQVGISADPPLVLFAVQHTSTTWPVLRRADRLGVSVLGEAHDGVARRLAAKGDHDRFRDVETTRTPTGAVLVAGAPLHLETSIEGGVRAGDHDVVLLRVHAVGSEPAVPPLVFHGSAFRRLSPADAAA